MSLGLPDFGVVPFEDAPPFVGMLKVEAA